jgi:hypothetical protein
MSGELITRRIWVGLAGAQQTVDGIFACTEQIPICGWLQIQEIV